MNDFDDIKFQFSKPKGFIGTPELQVLALSGKIAE